MISFKKIIENRQISDKLSHKISITNDEERIFLRVEYNNGSSVVEKQFQNNSLGLEEMELTAKKLDTEEKVCNYLGIGETVNGK